MLERSSMPMPMPLGRRKRWVLAAIGWTMLGSVLIYLQYKLDYRVGAYGALPAIERDSQSTDAVIARTFQLFTRRATKTNNNDIAVVKNDGVASSMPYLPVDYLPMDRSSELQRKFNESCAILPTIFDVKINNVHWQHLVTDDGTNFYFYGAYYDNRLLTEGHPQVRIIGMADRIPPPKTFCQFWYENKSSPSFSSDETTHHYIWHPKRGNSKNGTLQPVLLNCPMPIGNEALTVPLVVSVVERVCDNATNAIKIISNVNNKLDTQSSSSTSTSSSESASIAVCVKGLNYLNDDKSVRLVEWLELLRILGVDRVFMYELSVHQNISKVLRHYQNQGFVDVRPLTLPGDQINDPRLRALYLSKRIIHKRQNEIIPYNDCLYRNIGLYDYVALLDIDEVIVPMSPDVITWQQLIENVDAATNEQMKVPRRASLCAQHVYFFDNTSTTTESNEDDYPSYLHMLTHVRRARNFTKPWQYVKCFHDTRQVLTLHNHFPMACGRRPPYKCPIVTMDVEHGRLHHYRKGCTIGLEDVCAKSYMSDTVIDDTVRRYGDDLTSRSNAALKTLGFLT